MRELVEKNENDSYLQRMKESRKGAAVLKVKLANIRSELPNDPILAFEGIDDKTVYYHWIAKIRPDLKYEPFPCDGKTQVLDLVEMVGRDLGGIGKGVYFFVDRDFDDLRRVEKIDGLFMTDFYSVENYLVSEIVVEELLKNEFHCHGEVRGRDTIVELFKSRYSEFIGVSKGINFRVYLARKLGIKIMSPLPDKIGKLAVVSIDRVECAGYAVEDIVPLEREPTEDEKDSLRGDFESLVGRDRYRGKFSLLFFMAWLRCLAEDRNSRETKCFKWVGVNNKVRIQDINLGNLASKSDFPINLEVFINGIRGVI